MRPRERWSRWRAGRARRPGSPRLDGPRLGGRGASRWRLFALALFGAASLGCESEREFSGIWRQVCEGDFRCADGQVVYELNLGRYGDEVAGVIVQYVYAADLMTFDRLNDCGCFFVESGRAQGDALGFRILDPEDPGFPDETGTRAESCEAQPPPPCVNGTFALSGDEDQLEGRLSCDGAPGPTIRFEPVNGTPRRTCLWNRDQ